MSTQACRILHKILAGDGADHEQRGMFRDSHGPRGVRVRLRYAVRDYRRSLAGLLRDYRATVSQNTRTPGLFTRENG